MFMGFGISLNLVRRWDLLRFLKLYFLATANNLAGAGFNA
jgi:hypothetical protein